PRELAESLGVSQQTLRNWRRQDQIDCRERDDGPTSDEQDALRRLRRETARLRQERDLLKGAAAFFGRSPSPGDGLPVDLGGEGPHPGLGGVSAARRLALGLYEWAGRGASGPALTAAWRSETPRGTRRTA